jgi:hypothetical protein
VRTITLAGLQSFLKELTMDHISLLAGSSVWKIRYVSTHVSLFFLKAILHVSNTNLQVISSKLLEAPDHKHDHKRVFLSEEKNDNMIESIISKVNIIHVGPNVRASLILSI